MRDMIRKTVMMMTMTVMMLTVSYTCTLSKKGRTALNTGEAAI